MSPLHDGHIETTKSQGASFLLTDIIAGLRERSAFLVRNERDASARLSNRRPMTRQGTTIPRFNLAAGLSAHLAAGVTVPRE